MERYESLAGVTPRVWFRVHADPDPAYFCLEPRRCVPVPARVHGKPGFRLDPLFDEAFECVSTYVLEDFDRDLGVTVEDLKLGSFFLRRYLVPTSSAAAGPLTGQDDGMLLVMLVARRPLKPSEYERLLEVMEHALD